MIAITKFFSNFPMTTETLEQKKPWEITSEVRNLVEKAIAELDDNYAIDNGIAVHKTAIIEPGVTLKSPVIVSENCFIGANAYFREGVFLDKNVRIGPGCEIKSTIICSNTAIAHFNYIGNSIIGQDVNFEAGAIAANHYNERKSKDIRVKFKGKIINTGVSKFGALVGDGSKIGANAVLSPGTLLEKNTTVKRLELVEQAKE
ncbi:DapH/DapD/GlmU-related protein [Kriegella aquimaris]|uniref:Hexapeptide repeat of succinyl-transferase n=1 Tax=Kriegella aquimaris TaxID=192904 RepID=A0A1G9K0U2_9FLAO|nr:DapH/DapD/GlmU-related protein [Kriegella aquimaris]SDL43457.1 Hexapeptide repeat of succinyl-transferase [Kriegella aquimaris]